MKRVLAVINPVAGMGVGCHVASQLAVQAAKFGLELTLRFTPPDSPARILFHDAGAFDRVIVSGGDGTLMEAMNGLAHTRIPLAIIAGGTGNVVARALGLATNLEVASAEALAPDLQRMPLDLGLLNNEHYFFMRFSAGYEAQVMYDSTREAKNRLGIVAYAINAVRHVVRLNQTRYSLEIDGRKTTRTAHSLWVANLGATGLGPLALDPDIRANDGHLDLCTIRLTDPNSVTEGVLKLLQQTKLPAQVVSHIPIRQRIVVTTAEPQPVQADGEFVGYTPSTIAVAPRAITLAIPQRAFGRFQAGLRRAQN
jgi:YegS/Rv2252/BmrU family lipid kinase